MVKNADINKRGVGNLRGYVFIGNSSKPNESQQKSREDIILQNVTLIPCSVALEMGYKVFVGVNRGNPEGLNCNLPVTLYDSHTYRSLLDIKSNLIAFKNLKRLIKQNDIEVIHCNSPVGGLVGRICCKICGVKKIIYTAHGFHFYKGAPLFNRTIIKLAEKIMARFTDALIVINNEDFEVSKSFKLKKGGKVYLLNGVGISCDEFLNVNADKSALLKPLGISENDVVCISMGDLNDNKNYQTAIKAVAKCQRLHYLICGVGEREESLKALCRELDVSDRVHFLGYRSDVKELLAVSDIFLLSSFREGLSRSAMEAMASALPCVVSDIRGNVDLIQNDEGGFVCKATDDSAFAEALNKLASDEKLRQRCGKRNLEKVKDYDKDKVKIALQKIYSEVLSS